ncbi:hypothetical protein ECD90_09085, partial [Acinetobacter pittii]|nr:hypothetical protein [Acinetobacter pittii]
HASDSRWPTRPPRRSWRERRLPPDRPPSTIPGARRRRRCRPTLLWPRIRDEPFPKGFSLPRDTPKYNGSVKPEDWLIDYSSAVSIANGNRRVAVKYVPLMLQGMACTWLNSLKPHSVNSWLDFTEVFVRNFTNTYKRPTKPRQLSLCVQGPS